MRGHRRKFFRAAAASGAVAVLFAIVSVAAAMATGGGSVSSPKTASPVSDRDAGDSNGRWIAYSTAPASDGSGGYPPGGTVNGVFVTRIGGRPKLVAGQGRGAAWNLCPVFSPNGRMLAFARESRAGSTIVVVRVARHGPLGGGRLVLKVRGGRARCPRWSSDSSRLAYLDHGRVVVRDLHGARRHWANGDPAIRDFDTSVDELVSPSGSLVARRGPDGTIVSRLDGSDQRVIKDSSYAIAGWSPDGHKLLFMTDVGGGFRMRAVSVYPPFASETVVAYARVRNARSWPGYGDVSWQPTASARRQISESAAAPWPACPAIYPGPGVRQKLSGNVCGPSRVIPGVNYSFTVVATNISGKTFHPFTLHVSHYDPFTRTSRPYRRTRSWNGDPIMKGAAWTVKQLAPGQSLRISFTLPFKRHLDPKGSNFDVRELGTHDVVFVKPR